MRFVLTIAWTACISTADRAAVGSNDYGIAIARVRSDAGCN
jgi:hypothetical protein